jgi:hypothetical protein
MNKIETRAVVKYLCKKGLSPQDNYKDTLKVLGDSTPSYQVIKNWSLDFKLRRESCKHAPGAGAPKTAVTKENIDLVHDMVPTDRRVSVIFIAESCSFPMGTAEKILYDELRLKKILARCVPKILTARPTRHRWDQFGINQ